MIKKITALKIQERQSYSPVTETEEIIAQTKTHKNDPISQNNTNSFQ